LIQKEEDWQSLLLAEEQEVETMCNSIIKWKPDIVVTEKVPNNILKKKKN
jgi:T-complex protein 1 subunit gamma